MSHSIQTDGIGGDFITENANDKLCPTVNPVTIHTTFFKSRKVKIPHVMNKYKI